MAPQSHRRNPSWPWAGALQLSLYVLCQVCVAAEEVIIHTLTSFTLFSLRPSSHSSRLVCSPLKSGNTIRISQGFMGTTATGHSSTKIAAKKKTKTAMAARGEDGVCWELWKRMEKAMKMRTRRRTRIATVAVATREMTDTMSTRAWRHNHQQLLPSPRWMREDYRWCCRYTGASLSWVSPQCGVNTSPRVSGAVGLRAASGYT